MMKSDYYKGMITSSVSISQSPPVQPMKPGIGKTHPVQWGPLPSRLAFFQREVVDQLFILFLLTNLVFSRDTGKSHVAQPTQHGNNAKSYAHVSRNGRMFA